jgi:hypothetical protein
MSTDADIGTQRFIHLPSKFFRKAYDCSPGVGVTSEWTRWAEGDCLYKGVVRKKIKRKQNQVDEGLS